MRDVHRVLLTLLVVVAGCLGATAAAQALARPSLLFVGFRFDGTSEFGDYALKVRVANMVNGNVRICVSGACRNFGANGRLNVTDAVFGQRWKHGQVRTVVVAACNSAGCMPISKGRLGMF